MIFPRKEVKAHGTRRLIEGNFEPGETIVVVDDILISGNSAMEGPAKLQSAGLQVQDIVVFLDHGQGVKEKTARTWLSRPFGSDDRRDHRHAVSSRAN